MLLLAYQHSLLSAEQEKWLKKKHLSMFWWQLNKSSEWIDFWGKGR